MEIDIGQKLIHTSYFT